MGITKYNIVELLPEKKKIRKKLLVFGIILIIIGSGNFIPIPSIGKSVFNQSVFCNSEDGNNAQIINEVSEDCKFANRMTLFANVIITIGLVLTIVRILKKKSCLQK